MLCCNPCIFRFEHEAIIQTLRQQNYKSGTKLKTILFIHCLGYLQKLVICYHTTMTTDPPKNYCNPKTFTEFCEEELYFMRFSYHFVFLYMQVWLSKLTTKYAVMVIITLLTSNIQGLLNLLLMILYRSHNHKPFTANPAGVCDTTWQNYMYTCLTHCILNRHSHTIYWKSPISILGMSGYETYIFLEKNGLTICEQWRPWSDTTLCGVWSGSALFANYPFTGLLTTVG